MQEPLLKISNPPIFKYIMRFNIIAGLFLLTLLAVSIGNIIREQNFNNQTEVYQRQKARENHSLLIAMNNKM